MFTQTLILTQSFHAHKVVSWQRAVMLLFQGKIEVIEEYSEISGFIEASRLKDFKKVVQSYPGRLLDGDLTIFTPSVIRLRKYSGNMKRGIKFSRVNVLTRDGFKCQYCGEHKRMADCNYDHVVPRVQGGKTEWTNIVTSCYPCNRKKADRTPEQAGMKLKRVPYKPKSLPVLGPKFDPKKIPIQWIGYLNPVNFDESAAEVA